MLDALTLDQIRMFAAVADSGSFRAAAAQVGRAQSAVSFAIANLEDQLGLPLFDRSGYRPKLTKEGRALLEDAHAVLLKVGLMRSRARSLGDGLELALGIAVDPMFPRAGIGHALRNLQHTYPSVTIRLTVEPLGGTYAAMSDGRATFAVCVGKWEETRLEFEHMGEVRMAAVVAADHPLAEVSRTTERLGSAELADHVQIVISDPTQMTEGRDFGVMSPSTWRVSDLESKHALILAGTGWGNLPLWMVSADLDAGRLVRVPASGLEPGGESRFRTYLAHHIDSPLGPAARHLRTQLLCCTEAIGASERSAGRVPPRTSEDNLRVEAPAERQ